MSTHPMTHDEFFESLNGFEELAIAKEFGAKPIPLSETDQSALLRALVFAAKMRDGLDHKAAKQFAMEATLGDCGTYFAEDDEPTPEDPVTEAGKGTQLPGATPSSSQPSASAPESNRPSFQR